MKNKRAQVNSIIRKLAEEKKNPDILRWSVSSEEKALYLVEKTTGEFLIDSNWEILIQNFEIYFLDSINYLI